MELCRNLLSLFPNMLAVTPKRHNGLTTIITLDSHFDRIDGLRRLDPGDGLTEG